MKLNARIPMPSHRIARIEHITLIHYMTIKYKIKLNFII